MFKKIHHIDYVVRDIDKAIDLYEKVFGLSVKERRVLNGSRELATFEIGDIILVLVMPIEGKESLAKKVLDEHGEGFFHIAFEVDDIEGRMEELKEKGVSLIDSKPKQGIDWKTATIDPKSTFGVLTQLVGL